MAEINIFVKTGTNKLDDEYNGRAYDVILIFVHPSFSNVVVERHDIALLKVSYKRK